MSSFNTNIAISKSRSSDHLKQRERLPICEICQECESQYICPRCGLRSCSLPCCRAHKAATGCSGKRDVTAYMALSAMTDQTLLSDYHFLSGGSKHVDTSRRLWNTMEDATTEREGPRRANHIKRPRHSHHRKGDDMEEQNSHMDAMHPILLAAKASTSDVASRIPFWSETSGGRDQKGKISFTPLHVLRLAGVKLLELPSMMERHRNNQSKIITSSPPVIHWTTEIKFICQHQPWELDIQKMNCNRSGIQYTEHLSSSVPYYSSTFLLHAIPETLTLRELHQRAADKLHLLYNDLSKLPEANGVRDPVVWLIKQIPCPDNRPVYIEKGTDSDEMTLSDLVRNATLIEFPTLYMIAQRHYETLQVHFPCSIREVLID